MKKKVFSKEWGEDQVHKAINFYLMKVGADSVKDMGSLSISNIGWDDRGVITWVEVSHEGEIVEAGSAASNYTRLDIIMKDVILYIYPSETGVRGTYNDRIRGRLTTFWLHHIDGEKTSFLVPMEHEDTIFDEVRLCVSNPWEITEFKHTAKRPEEE